MDGVARLERPSWSGRLDGVCLQSSVVVLSVWTMSLVWDRLLSCGRLWTVSPTFGGPIGLSLVACLGSSVVVRSVVWRCLSRIAPVPSVDLVAFPQ